MSIILKFRAQLPVIVREELDQLVASLQDLEAVVMAGGGGGGGGTGTGPIGPAGPPGPTGPAAALAYLGDYAAGPAYRDGDIVVAADGIAYMCVVDGTTTPPEPWPGGNVAINATVDASYWVTSGHAALTNERVMSALANGYVKSTAGEPSTVAVIPVTDGGTGASTTAAARTNLGIGTVGVLNLNGNAAQYLNGAGAWTTPPVVPGVPTGAIILMTVPCPAGYTRVAAWDGYYVRMGATHVAGGAASHTHGVGTYASAAHTHPVGTLAVASHNHDSGSLAVASHTHSVAVSGTTGADGDHNHTYSGSTGGESNGSAVMDAGGGMNCVRAPHTHVYSGSTSTAPTHTHGFSASATSGAAAPDVTGNTSSNAPAISGATGSTGPTAIAGTSASAANNPLYIDFYACQKD
jgi:hypothetical protein